MKTNLRSSRIVVVTVGLIAAVFISHNLYSFFFPYALKPTSKTYAADELESIFDDIELPYEPLADTLVDQGCLSSRYNAKYQPTYYEIRCTHSIGAYYNVPGKNLDEKIALFADELEKNGYVTDTQGSCASAYTKDGLPSVFLATYDGPAIQKDDELNEEQPLPDFYYEAYGPKLDHCSNPGPSSYSTQQILKSPNRYEELIGLFIVVPYEHFFTTDEAEQMRYHPSPDQPIYRSRLQSKP